MNRQWMKGSLVVLSLLLTGCMSTPPDVAGSDIEKATTNVDAVEGKEKESKGLIDMIRT